MRHTHQPTGAALLACLTISTAARLPAQGDGRGKATLERCEQPLGTLAVVEPQDEVIAALQRYQLQSPAGLIRMMVQQSGCFQVVERGQGMRNVRQERELAQSGQLQQGANVGQGQLRAADYVLTPNVLFADDAGGVAGGLAGLGRRVGVLGVVAGGLKFKEAQTSMLVSDVRSGLQVAAAEGKAKKTDFGLGMLGWGGGAVGAVGGYTNTNEGKVIAASFLDNYNRIVVAVRADSSLRKPPGDPAAGVKAGATFAEGDVLAPKIDNVRLLAEPADAARAVGALRKADELVYLGEERNGFLRVQGAAAEGWVKKTMVAKR